MNRLPVLFFHFSFTFYPTEVPSGRVMLVLAQSSGGFRTRFRVKFSSGRSLSNPLFPPPLHESSQPNTNAQGDAWLFGAHNSRVYLDRFKVLKMARSDAVGLE